MRIGAYITLIAALALGGCASVTRGTQEQVVFDSDPPGAEMRSVIVDICGEEKTCDADSDEKTKGVLDRSNKPGPVCVTPCTLQIKRSDELIATFTKPGYEPATLRIGRKLSGAGGVGIAGNVLIGGVGGLMVDGITGAGTDHVPNPAKVTLEPVVPVTPIKRKK